VYAVVITGAPGSGKSQTLEALADVLHDHDIAHACIDADALNWAHPAPSTEAQMRHVAALADLYGGEGCDLLLVADREPAGWSQLGRLLDRASRMHGAMATMAADLVVDTERTVPQSAAERICRACPRLDVDTTRP